MIAALALTGLLASTASGYTILERVSGGNIPAGNAAQPAAFADSSIDGVRQFFDTKEQLATDDTDAATDVYERANSSVTRISAGQVNGNGAQDALFAASSESGARVFFHTKEALVAADTDASRYDVYERFNGTTTLMSTGPSTTNAAVDAFLRGISLDGTHVFFETSEVLTSADTDTRTDVYERTGGSTSLISVGPTSATGSFSATFRGASSSGGAAFFETNDRLASADVDSSTDVYLRSGSTTTLVSQGPNGGNAAVTASFDAIIDDGSRVFFHTNEPLVATDTDGFADVYQWTGGTTTLLSTGPSGGNGPRHADYAGVSTDGTRVIFETDESLVGSDTDTNFDVYERNAGTTTTLLSTGPSGGNGAFDATAVAVSDNGNRVLFDTKEKLTTNDTDANFFDIYDRTGGTTTSLLSTNASGASGAFDSFFAGLSNDGDVVFDTQEKFDVADTDSVFDTYVRQGTTLSLVSKGPHAGNGAFNVTFVGMTPDGASIFLHSNEQLAADDTDAVQDVYRSTDPGLGYARPIGATPLRMSLVPAYDACTSPNRVHGPPDLPGGANPDQSCAPPTQASTSITVGTPDAGGGAANFVGFVKLDVIVGVPGPPDDSNVAITINLSDIRCRAGTTACGAANAAGGADYTGQLQVKFPTRMTDRWNSTTTGGSTDFATSTDNTLDVNLTCAATTGNTAQGSDCNLNTSANAISSTLVRDGKRAIWRMDQVTVMDGGTDGLISTTSGNKTFARQGIFIP